jgi:hypothetical protein
VAQRAANEVQQVVEASNIAQLVEANLRFTRSEIQIFLNAIALANFCS